MDERELLESLPTRLWLAGEQVEAAGGARFDVHNPATAQVLTTVADAGPDDGDAALAVAVAAGEGWAATTPRERSEILRRIYEGVIEHAETLALLMTLEMGKALPESRTEVHYGAEFFRWFAEQAVRIHGRYGPAPAGNGRIVVHKQPVGVCLAITPWNFPLAMGTRKIAPALAAGATMIVKPAAETPLTMLWLAQLCSDAGLPSGVLQVLPTSHASALTDPLIADARLRKLTFTGSTAVGKLLVRRSADRLLRTSMELGGNAPFVVFDDADIDAAVAGALVAKIRNGGEACTAANRFHVHNRVRDEFTDKLTAAMSQLVLGAGVDPDTTLGPVINADQLQIICDLVDDATTHGGRVRLGGKPIGGPGWFYPATVITEVTESARILREEVFGPVAAITGFDTEDEGIAAANRTEYGLAAYIYTQGLDRALRVAEAVESGMVGVNRGVISDAAAPFGGIKESGFGREGGFEGIEEYLNTKYIAL